MNVFLALPLSPCGIAVQLLALLPRPRAVSLPRLQKLEQAMVGGERADDSALKERRMRRRRAAQQRLQMLSQVLAKVEDEDGMVLKVYDDIQEELRVKTEALRKNRQKVNTLHHR